MEARWFVGFDEYDRTVSKSSRWLARLSTWDWPPQCWISSTVTLEEYTHPIKFPGYTVMKIKEIPTCLERDLPVLWCYDLTCLVLTLMMWLTPSSLCDFIILVLIKVHLTYKLEIKC